jgi:hypothetical protein
MESLRSKSHDERPLVLATMKADGVYIPMNVFVVALIVAFPQVGTYGAQDVQHARLVACACEIEECLTSAQMAQHAVHVEMEPDRMGNHSNYQGVAVFQIGFDEKGRVTGAQAISGHPLGISHLMAAVSTWRFRPAIVKGTRKRACGKLFVKFTMKENVPSAKVVKQE